MTLVDLSWTGVIAIDEWQLASIWQKQAHPRDSHEQKDLSLFEV